MLDGSQQNLSDVDPVLLGPGWLIENRQFDAKMALSKGFPLFHHVFSTELKQRFLTMGSILKFPIKPKIKMECRHPPFFPQPTGPKVELKTGPFNPDPKCSKTSNVMWATQ